jgi:oxygen-independent coproporphyrinogen-3 oxidase
VITRRRDIVDRYLEHLYRELGMAAAALGGRRRLIQYHWGGGTPTHLTPGQMRDLQRAVLNHFDLEDGAEAAIEMDPCVTTHEQLGLLKDLGFNRLSMGVQDFTPKVQVSVHRIQTFERTADLVECAREMGFRSINLDLIYGLPRQTPESFARSLRRVLEIRPERLAVYSFAYLPSKLPHQRRIDPASLPTPAEKLETILQTWGDLTAAGYLPIGMDHFALPEDELGKAIRSGTLWRNFMGYTVQRASDGVACGVSAIGEAAGGYFQNRRKLSSYMRDVAGGSLPIERGYLLTDDDRLRRHVIMNLMCRFSLDKRETGRLFGIDFDRTFALELRELEGCCRDGLVELEPDRIQVTGLGRFFVRNLCMVFDAHCGAEQRKRAPFSRTV